MVRSEFQYEELVTKYTTFYYLQLKNEGYPFTWHEVFSELASQAFQAVPKFDQSRDAKMETFLIETFKRRVLMMKRMHARELKKERAIAAMCAAEDGFVIPNFTEHHEKRDLLALFDGRERAIVAQLLDPAPQTQEAMRGFAEKRRGNPGPRGSSFDVIATTLRLTEKEMRTSLRKIRQKLIAEFGVERISDIVGETINI